METVIDKFGRVVIPKEVRDDFGLSAGSVLRIEENIDGIVLKPVPEQPDVLVKEGVLVFDGLPTGDLAGTLKDVREERSQTLFRRKKRSS